MAKNPNPAGSSATTDSPSNSAAVGSEKDTPHSGNSGTAEPEEVAGAKTSLKLNVKTAAAAVASTSESQVATNSILTKQRKLNTPSTEEEDNVDLKCLLLADATLQCAPLHLHQMLQHIDVDKTSNTAADILLILIYCIALETGFITRSEFTKSADIIMRLSPTSSYHSKNVLRMSRHMPTYSVNENKQQFVMQLCNIANVPTSGSQSTLLNSQLTCLVTGDFFIVTLTPDRTTNIPGRSVCLSIGRYVLNAHPKGKELFQCFRKLDELSRLLRENVFVPMRNCQLEGLAVSVYPALLGLPAELYENIFQYLSRNQLKIVANVNKQLNYLSTQSKYYF